MITNNYSLLTRQHQATNTQPSANSNKGGYENPSSAQFNNNFQQVMNLLLPLLLQLLEQLKNCKDNSEQVCDPKKPTEVPLSEAEKQKLATFIPSIIQNDNLRVLRVIDNDCDGKVSVNDQAIVTNRASVTNNQSSIPLAQYIVDSFNR